MTRPRIFCVFGMPRTGTTYLYHALAKHPQIFVPYRKETHYFSVNYGRGERWFTSLYSGMAASQIGADINPMYFLDTRAEQRLLAYDPEVKVVLGVREPTEFAVSLYGNMLAHGLRVPSILAMVERFDWPLVPEESLSFSLADGFLERRVETLRAHFGANLLVYDYDHFDRSPLPVLRELEQHLGLQPFFAEDNLETVRINASGRRDPFGMNALIANQRVLDTLYALLPRAAVVYARRAFERFAARGVAPRAEAARVSPNERATLQALLGSDTAYYRQLFDAAPVLRAGAT